MKSTQPPRVIYLQVLGEDRRFVDSDDECDVDSEEVTWSADQVFDTDIRYVIDKRYGKRGHAGE